MKLMLYRIARLTKKELLAVLKDRRSRFLLIGPPLLQLLIFSFAATLEVRNVTLGVYMEDHGRAARDLLARFQGAQRTFRTIRYYRDLKTVRQAIDNQEILAAIHIGPDFSKHIELGVPERVQVILDGRNANAASVVQGYINRIVEDYVKETLSRLHEPGIAKATSLDSIVTRKWFNPNADPQWSTVSALVGVLCNLVVLLITALSIARERELGTFEQLLVSPLRPAEILIGKSVPAILLGFIEGIFMTCMAVVIFDLPLTLKGFVLLLGTIFAFVFSVVGVGLFVSSIAKTQQQGFLGAFTYQVPATLLCGFATPVENVPDWLRWLAYVNPLQYMVTLSRTIFLENPSTRVVLSMAWPLVPIGLVTLAAATALFRRRMQ
ncbi:MAG TPA: ABC transporter permease [Acidobacteriota bacterium]|jgi:ABC-2 type transport system permease protein|nr:ABC transporter permease [Acidobacteriota bacterium]